MEPTKRHLDYALFAIISCMLVFLLCWPVFMYFIDDPTSDSILVAIFMFSGAWIVDIILCIIMFVKKMKWDK